MQLPKAALLPHTDPAWAECPVLDGSARDDFLAAAKAANRFSEAVVAWRGLGDPPRQAAWLRASVSASRVLLQPWTLEILFVISFLGRARFAQLHELLGLSTRTLSDKLKILQAEGFVDRAIVQEQPVRVEYTATRHGRRTAALATPLIAHLNLEALRAHGRR